MSSHTSSGKGDRDASANQVIIGIDFGTTFSGVAYTYSNKIDRMEIITSWDSDLHSNSDEEKAPTAISYGPQNELVWGYAIPSEKEQLKWFKLLLLDSEDLPDDIRDSNKLKEARLYLEKHNKTAEEAISVFLRHLWNHSIQRITETIGRNMMNYSSFHVVMTLPAIWPSYAQNRMREAARAAGILGKRIAGETQLTFVSEPEAAALATLEEMEDRFDVKAGDTFVVADCGGGTSDLISYQCTSTNPLIIKECVKGTGGLCGAVFVDEAFSELLKSKFPKKKWEAMEAISRYRLLHDEWETGIKQQFDMNRASRGWSINMPWECMTAKERRGSAASTPKLEITGKEVKGVFDPIIEKITNLIDGQIIAVKKKTGANPKVYVVMVGGFGRCRYLFQMVKDNFGDDIEILQSRGAAPWTAICRGAVIHAATMQGLGKLSVQIRTRIARASYGVCLRPVWDASKHLWSDKEWDDISQLHRAKNQMFWLLREGDDTSAKEPIIETVVHHYDTSETTVTKLCSVKWETAIVVPSLPLYTNPLGKIYHKLNYEYHMTCAGESVDFAIYHNGKRQGSKNVSIDYSTD
ncbi:hypothetical protein B0T20DRAFT_498039 [Sordaria brevicollis]|uniref:Actin-like ATPase domain-containing protein n=1 Tax=Sordaria brevicollis TaxID=83679 RepID=A0AAE0UBR0_SORBR|nr:hypothetical protein B0T20DRAFT_498039 [Sordaria brevicollis]